MQRHQRFSRANFTIKSADDDDDDELEDLEIKDKTWPKWKIWLDVEASREAKHWLPWRPDKTKGQSEEDCEDPDRQVRCIDFKNHETKIDLIKV